MSSDTVVVKLEEMGFTIETVFVPWSQSRNSNEKSPSLNYNITLFYNGKKVLVEDYMMGCGHCPSYEQRETYDSRNAVKMECEQGYKARGTLSSGYFISDKKSPIRPSIADFMYSIVVDSEAIDYEFEDWAVNFGYEEDSRKAELIYNQCQKTGLKLMRSIGTQNIQILHELFQDY